MKDFIESSTRHPALDDEDQEIVQAVAEITSRHALKGKRRVDASSSRREPGANGHGIDPATVWEMIRDDQITGIHSWRMSVAGSTNNSDVEAVVADTNTGGEDARICRDNSPVSFAISDDAESRHAVGIRPDGKRAGRIRREITKMVGEVGSLRHEIDDVMITIQLAGKRMDHIQQELRNARRFRKVLENDFFSVLKQDNIFPSANPNWDSDESEEGITDIVVGEEEVYIEGSERSDPDPEDNGDRWDSEDDEKGEALERNRECDVEEEEHGQDQNDHGLEGRPVAGIQIEADGQPEALRADAMTILPSGILAIEGVVARDMPNEYAYIPVVSSSIPLTSISTARCRAPTDTSNSRPLLDREVPKNASVLKTMKGGGAGSGPRYNLSLFHCSLACCPAYSERTNLLCSRKRLPL